MHRKREEELGAPAEAEPVRIRTTVFAAVGSSDPRNLHWSALVIWKRDTGEVATFTENISYARIEKSTRTEHFRFVCSQATGQRQSSARARQAAHSPPQVPGRLLPASTQEDTRFLGITTPVPSSDPPISQVRGGRLGKPGRCSRWR